MPRFIDRTGHEVGLWKVLQRGPTLRTPQGKTKITWMCLCVGCDKIKAVDASNLGTKSQGCNLCRRPFNWEGRDQAFELRQQGLTTAEIARRMGISDVHAWRLLNKGRGQLRRKRTTRTDRPPAGQLARPQPAGIPS